MASQNDNNYKDAQKALFKAIDNTGYDVNKMRSILSQTDLIPDITLYLLWHTGMREDTIDINNVVKLFLAKGSDPNRSSNEFGNPLNPLNAAITLYASNDQLVRILLEGGANPNNEDDGFNPLRVAITNNTPLLTTRLLLEHGADPNNGKEAGGALVNSIQLQRINIVRLLLNNPMNPADPDLSYLGQVPLVEASNIPYRSIARVPHDRKLEMLNLLLEKGADPDTQDKHGSTALHNLYACHQAIQALLEKGANPNIENNNGETPLSTILLENVRLGRNVWSQERLAEMENIAYENVNTLLRAGADPNMGTTPALIYATRMLSNRIVTSLLENQADPNLTNRFGDTALIYAASLSDNPEIIINLLKHGANPNLKNKDGQTALINAAARGHENVASILLKAGADKNARDKDGKGFITYIDQLPRLKVEYLKEVKGEMMNRHRGMPSDIANEIVKFLFKGKKSKKKSVKNKKKSGSKKKSKKSVGKKTKKSIRRVRK